MTRLRTEDIKPILQALKAYDQHLLNVTGRTLKGIACHAHGLPDSEFEDMVTSFKICVIPMTSGQGVIKQFSETVSGIVSHLRFQSCVAQQSDAAGIAEAIENKSDILLLADDDRFVAINLQTKTVSDNIEMTARGFVAGLDLMASGLKEKKALVIGCGDVGSATARALAAMGALVSVCDIDPELASTLQREIMDAQAVMIDIDDDWRSTPGRYPYIVDATPAVDLIDASVITPETCIAVPGVPCGLSAETRQTISNRYLHDPLQIGVATMVIDACKNSL